MSVRGTDRGAGSGARRAWPVHHRSPEPRPNYEGDRRRVGSRRDDEAVRVIPIRFGRQLCGDLDEASQREWLVTDGLGGYAMGTVSGLRTRRYHALLVPSGPGFGRRVALASLDPVLVVGDRHVRLATHEWTGGAVEPAGHVHLASFAIEDGVPHWRWALGSIVVERRLAMTHGQSATGIVHRLVQAPGPVRLELEALCTWRDANGERGAGGPPDVTTNADGFTFEGAYRVRGPGFEPDGQWYRGVWYREEAGRGLPASEDLWFTGRFVADLAPGQEMAVEAWAGGPPPPPASIIVEAARRRTRQIVLQSKPADDADATLAHAADQFVVEGGSVIAGYPWFGSWARDTMTSYEGLFLATGRADEGRDVLRAHAARLDGGLLPNAREAATTGDPEYNSVDAPLWFLHAVERHVHETGDTDLAAELVVELESIVSNFLAGTRYGIVVDPADALVTQGTDGVALTWMDARIGGTPVTPRWGKPVEIESLWINALGALGELQRVTGRDATAADALATRARTSFVARFAMTNGLYDVIDGRGGNDLSRRPNQLLAVSLPHGPLAEAGAMASAVVRSAAPLVTSLGLRTLAADAPSYRPRHRGGPVERDLAYHQGTVWPWLLGPYADAARRAGEPADAVFDGIVDHLAEWGLGSVSETADGAAPHRATGCPFQAWSVAEILRARRV